MWKYKKEIAAFLCPGEGMVGHPDDKRWFFLTSFTNNKTFTNSKIICTRDYYLFISVVVVMKYPHVLCAPSGSVLGQNHLC